KVEPFASAVEELKTQNPGAKVALMTPGGKLFNQRMAQDFSSLPGLIILCGRYEGVDERVSGLFCDMEVSIGDYVLTGGEIPAMVMLDCVARLVPGVVGEEASIVHESHSDSLLEHPHYTRPAEFRDARVPEVLLNGDHKKIEAWRREEAIKKTASVRPDLLAKAVLTEKERVMAGDFMEKARRRDGDERA
ncbi:MAG: tRNA (guanosine(37)-N1)-methyltransferase TrmD, partial [Nitrospinae bacterium]|nr:tRNA (guanosine(37)-N1)-methyltransferase TrmD [Nitrospinota bacterium]